MGRSAGASELTLKTRYEELAPWRGWAGVAQAWDRALGNGEVRGSQESPGLARILCSKIIFFLFAAMGFGELMCAYVQVIV